MNTRVRISVRARATLVKKVSARAVRFFFMSRRLYYYTCSYYRAIHLSSSSSSSRSACSIVGSAEPETRDVMRGGSRGEGSFF